MYGKYDLYPLNIVSLATFSCQYALKITGTEIGLLTDVKLAFHYENGIRGRITWAFLPYAEVNNECIFNYDESKENSCIIDLYFNS